MVNIMAQSREAGINVSERDVNKSLGLLQAYGNVKHMFNVNRANNLT